MMVRIDQKFSESASPTAIIIDALITSQDLFRVGNLHVAKTIY